MKVFTRDQIEKVLPDLDLLPAMEAGFAAYSAGRAVVPPVGELLLEKGEVHIKYGYLLDEQYYVIKIASGFYRNPHLGLPSGNGLMLLYDQLTGMPVSILLDEGRLTDVRTAVAGAVAARHLAPGKVERIGMVGTGVQARLQLQHLRPITACRQVLAWGRGEPQLTRYREDPGLREFRIETTLDAAEILRTCNLVVTTTPAEAPLLNAADLQPGTHITAVGSDTAQKQELEAAILGRADLVVADSISQCLERGEIHRALAAWAITRERLLELGAIISGQVPGRTTASQITVADLTGVAVQDIKIATAVHEALT